MKLIAPLTVVITTTKHWQVKFNSKCFSSIKRRDRFYICFPNYDSLSINPVISGFHRIFMKLGSFATFSLDNFKQHASLSYNELGLDQFITLTKKLLVKAFTERQVFPSPAIERSINF